MKKSNVLEVNEDGLPIFDIERMLPEIFREYVAEVSRQMSTPHEMAAVFTLGGFGGFLGSLYRITPLKDNDWDVPCNLWVAVSAPPGSRKSDCLQRCLQFLNELDKEQISKYTSALSNWEEEQEKTKKSKESSFKKPPTLRLYTINDVTTEKLHEMLKDTPQGIIIVKDELMSTFREFEKKGREGDRTFYLTGWNGTHSYKGSRIARGHQIADIVCLSLIGSIQPDSLRAYIEDHATARNNDGLIQRFGLMIEVRGRLKGMKKAKDEKAINDLRDVYIKIKEELVKEKPFLYMKTKFKDGMSIRYFSFKEKAQKIFDEWLEENDNKVDNESLSIMAQHLSKYNSLIPKLSLIFQILHNFNHNLQDDVDVDQLNRAILWGKFLEAHARIIYASVFKDKEESIFDILLERLPKLPPIFKPRDIMKRGWHKVPKKTKELIEVLNKMCEQDLLIKVEEGYSLPDRDPIKKEVYKKPIYEEEEDPWKVAARENDRYINDKLNNSEDLEQFHSDYWKNRGENNDNR